MVTDSNGQTTSIEFYLNKVTPEKKNIKTFYESFNFAADSTSEENAEGCDVAMNNSAISHLLYEPNGEVEPDSTSEEPPKKKKKSNSKQSLEEPPKKKKKSNSKQSNSELEKLAIKPFKCPFPECSHRVKHKRNLYRHNKQTHGSLTPQGTHVVMRHVCNICGIKNLNYDNFNRHHQLNHADMPENFTEKQFEIVENDEPTNNEQNK